MNVTARTTRINKLQSLILAAMRCVKCANPACLRECPLRAELRGALKPFANTPRNWWAQERESAETCADEAIQESFA